MTNDDERRVVFDCNVFAQALITPAGHAADCINLVRAKRVTLFWSSYVLAEIRRIPDKATPRKLGITIEKAEALITLLAPFATTMDEPPAIYEHPTDPKDSHYVNLALAAGASLIVSRDKHLLNLSNPAKPAGSAFIQRFPQLHILQPEQLLAIVNATRK